MRLIKIEMGKAIKSKSFIISLMIGIGIAIVAAVFAILSEYNMWHIWEEFWINKDGTMNRNPHISTSTLFRAWIGGNFSSVFSSVFYYVLPLLASMSYSWSLCNEYKSGYIKHIVVKCGRLKYYLSKYIATFFIGAITIIVPLIINYIIVACFIPARMPDPGDVQYFAIYRDFLFSKLFYTTPLLFNIFFMLLDALFAGLWASFVMSLGIFKQNKFAIIIGSYIFLLFHQYFTSIVSAYRFFIELSPFNFLRAYESSSTTNGIVVTVTLLIIFGLSFCITVIRGKKDDIY